MSASVSQIGPFATTLNEDAAATVRAKVHLVEYANPGQSGVPPHFASLPLPSAASAGWGALSIFSGCGGLDLGFLQEGILARAAYDIDPKAIATYRKNLPDVAKRENLAMHSPAVRAGNVLLAGAPCQGFSTAGKRQVGDPRNALLMRVADIALDNRSQVIVVENVPAAVSGPHRRLWEGLEDRLRLAGYNVRRIFLEGPNCGLAQRRKRLFLVCWRGSDCINVWFKSRASITVREAVRGLEGASDNEVEWPEVGGRDYAIARRVAAGHKLSNVRSSAVAVATWDIPEVYGATSAGEREILSAVARLRRRNRLRSVGDGDPVPIERLIQDFGTSVRGGLERLVQAGYLRMLGDRVDLRQTYNGRYRRLDWDALSPTVDTRFGRIDLFLHPQEHRAMTPREAARIQGFPDAFEFSGSKKDKFVQIGNAVPPPMAAVLAEYVREAILKA